MKDAQVLSKELLVDSFKKVVKERIQFTVDDVQDWIYMDTPKSIVVIALTPDEELVLVKIYRHNLRDDYLELPAGGAEHDGETIEEAAKRELLEETGYSSEEMIDLGAYYVLPSETNRWTSFFLADNLLIARENILQTMDDFYKYFCKNTLKLKTKQGLTDEQLEHFAEIVAWNIWQMDGLKYVRPLSCKQMIMKSDEVSKDQLALFAAEKPKKQKVDCEGCRLGVPLSHTGIYAKIMNWQTGKRVRFVDIVNGGPK